MNRTFTAKGLLLLVLTGASLPLVALELKTAAQNSPPKYYLREDGSMGGVCVDILHAIERVDPQLRFSGYEEFLPFKRLQLYLESGRLDLFCGLKNSPERLDRYFFSATPLYRLNYVIAARSDDHVDIESLDDIRRLGEQGRILTVFGSAAGRFLKNEGALYVNDSAPTPAHVIRTLLAGRGRFAFYHDLGLKNAIESEAAEQRITILPISFSSYHHYTAYSKSMPADLVARLNQALQFLRNDGTMAKIYQKYGLTD